MQHFQGLNYRYQQLTKWLQEGSRAPPPECFIIENRFGQPGVHENTRRLRGGGGPGIPS